MITTTSEATTTLSALRAYADTTRTSAQRTSALAAIDALAQSNGDEALTFLAIVTPAQRCTLFDAHYITSALAGAL